MTETTSTQYTRHFVSRPGQHVYPSEHLVRVLLGRYPRLNLDRTQFPNQKLLEVGIGDGRNLPLFFNCGFDIAGTDISKAICDQAMNRYQEQIPSLDIKVGFNADLPFDSGTFDFLVSWNAIYYLGSPEEKIEETIAEYARVMKPGATLALSVAQPSNYLMTASRHVAGPTWQVRHDPFEALNGSYVHRFETLDAVLEKLELFFDTEGTGDADADHFGIRNSYYLIVAKRR